LKRGPYSRGLTVCVAACLALWSACAIWFFYARGWLYLFIDSEAHLNIARRIIDNRTPGYLQVGTVWLPLPHWLILPLVHSDTLWRNGLAGAIPTGLCFVVGGTLIFAATRRIFDSTAAGIAAAAVLALNPNLMYLQSTAMTEAVFLACLAGMLYGSVRFAEQQSWRAVLGTAAATIAATLTRYEGWFLIPFVAAYFLVVGKRRRVTAALLFGAIAALGPLFWFAHNWWLDGNPLGFYTGQYSARAIQGGQSYPGMNNWWLALLYYATDARMCAGWLLTLLAIAGAAIAIRRRILWPIVLLALPGIFYVWSMHSTGGTPIYVPTLWPFGYYNTRYGLAVLPLLAFCAAALVGPVANRRTSGQPVQASAVRPPAVLATAVVFLAALPWLVDPHPAAWITLREGQVSSEARLHWTGEIARLLGPRYRMGSGIVSSYGDTNGIYRRAGIPLRETLSVDNDLLYVAPLLRPDLLREEWAVIRDIDPMRKSLLANGRYTLKLRIVVKDAPAVEVYRR